jgi:hypothetical protein
MAGADADLLRQLCGSVALDTLAVIQHNVDYGSDPSDDEPDKHPGWALVEIDPKTDEPTGRQAPVLARVRAPRRSARPRRIRPVEIS